MNALKRFTLGVGIGAAGGAGLAAGIIHILPDNHNLQTVSAEPLVNFLQFVFQDLNINPERILTRGGAVIGGITGLLIAKVLPYQKKWLPAFLSLVVGILIGGIGLYATSQRWLNWAGSAWEHNYESDRAVMAVQNLRTLELATTNTTFLLRFQFRERQMLTNYLHESEEWETNPIEYNYATNAAGYSIVKKFLAAHTNSLPIGKDFEDSNLDTTNSAPIRGSSGH